MARPTIKRLEQSSSPYMMVRTDAGQEQTYFIGSTAGEILQMVDIGGGVLQPQFVAPSALGLSFNITDGTTTESVNVDSTNTITFATETNSQIQLAVSATDTLTFNLKDGAQGDLMYYNTATGLWANLGIGTAGQVLQVVDNAGTLEPQWVTLSGVLTVSGTTGGDQTVDLSVDDLDFVQSDGVSVTSSKTGNDVSITLGLRKVHETFNLTSGNTITVAGTLPANATLIDVFVSGSPRRDFTHVVGTGVITITEAGFAFGNSTGGTGGEDVLVSYFQG